MSLGAQQGVLYGCMLGENNVAWVSGRLREMRQPNAGCNAPAAIVTAAAQFVAIEDIRSRTCAFKPIDYSYSLGYHVSHPCFYPLQSCLDR